MSHNKSLTVKRLSKVSIGLLILSLFFVLSAVSAQTDMNNWEQTPDFTTAANNGYTWMLAPEQPTPQPGDLVWVVPVENNTPIHSEPDNSWVYVALGVSTVFFILATACLVKAKGVKLSKKAFAVVTVCLITLSMFTIFPMASADQTAKTGYKLATPQGPDYYICNYTDGSMGVIRGSDWANLMTYMGTSGGVPITPIWAGYTNNASAVWENIYDTISYGVVYSKEVAPSITTGGLTAWQASIPDKVEVQISYQGNEYKFANPTNTAGSPYTVSVGAKMLSGNYTAQDSAGRILWSSLDYVTVAQAANDALGTGGGLIELAAAQNFTYTAPLNLTGYVTLKSSGNSWLVSSADANCSAIQTKGGSLGTYPSARVTVDGVNIDGKKSASNTYGWGVDMIGYYSDVKNCIMYNCATGGIHNAGAGGSGAADNEIISNLIRYCGDGIKTELSGSDVNIKNNYIFQNDKSGIRIGAGDPVITENHIYTNGEYGIYASNTMWGTIDHNWIGGNNWTDVALTSTSYISQGWTIIGNMIEANAHTVKNSWNAITLLGTATYPVTNITIVGNDIYDTGSEAAYGIKMTYANNINIGHNVFRGTFGTGKIGVFTGCYNLDIDDNTGYNYLQTSTITAYGFNNTDPTELSNIVDGDLSTAATTGVSINTAAGYAGYIRLLLPFDPANFTTPLTLSLKVGSNATTGAVSGYWLYSDDLGSTYVTNSGYQVFSYTGTSTAIKYGQDEPLTSRYIEFGVYAAAASTVNMDFYEIFVTNK